MSHITELIYEPHRKNAHISLEQMLEVREKRVQRQIELNTSFRKPLIAFGMNIAGSIKSSPSISRAFDTGSLELEQKLLSSQIRLIHKEYSFSYTGDYTIYVVDAPALELKTICISIENTHPLGRLFDFDVIDTDMKQISRADLNEEERGCILCGAPGKVCAAGRVHSVPALQQHTAALLYNYFLETDSKKIMSIAAKSLRYEAWTSPKPGLVDMNNNGIHKDMDMPLLMSSISVIADFFRRFFLIGVNTAAKSAESTFMLLRKEGLLAEQNMLEITGGVNTHKGAIFLLGVLCGTLGRKWKPGVPFCNSHTLFKECSGMCSYTLVRELYSLSQNTATSYGEKLYLDYGCRGARGTVIDGFPEVSGISLPILTHGIKLGKEVMNAGRSALLHLIARVDDSNALHRNSSELWKKEQAKLAQLLQTNPYPGEDVVLALDSEFIDLGISPGGCADLLAVTYFVYFLENHNF